MSIQPGEASRRTTSLHPRQQHKAFEQGHLTPGIRNIAVLLAMPAVGPFLLGRTAAATASWMERVAIGWLTWQMTGAATWLGIIVFVRLMPAIVLSLAGGIVADRYAPSRLLSAAKTVSAGLSLTLFALVLTENLSMVLLFILTIIIGAVEAFSVASSKSILWQLTPASYRSVAIPFGTVLFNVAAFLGPAIAGGIIAFSGVYQVFMISTAAYLCFVIVIYSLPPLSRRPEQRQKVRKDITDSASYIWRTPAIRQILLLHISFCALIRPILDLLPGFVASNLVGGPLALGLLTGAVGAGAIGVGTWMAARGQMAGMARLCLLSAVTAPIALMALAWAQTVPFALGCLLVMGGAMVMRASGVQMLLHQLVEPDMRGRVMGVHTAVFRLGAGAGALLMAVAADVVGFAPTFIVAAAMALCVVLALWRSIRASADLGKSNDDQTLLRS